MPSLCTWAFTRKSSRAEMPMVLRGFPLGLGGIRAAFTAHKAELLP